ncbi:MAG TPA: hypothetical protein P5556_02385 [Candidatus Gastranaerophilales bacterium]|nr:hypothetical protein [Candidatus Gastranaerophilales bacterium]
MNKQNIKNLIVHAGFQKTGTSTLQSSVFPFLKDVYLTGYIDPDLYETPFGHLIGLINSVDEANQVENRIAAEYKISIENFINNRKEKNIIFSDEDLVGLVVPHRQKKYFNNDKFTKILKKTLPENVKIFLVFRKQSEWVESLYFQHVAKSGKNITINDYVGYKNGKFAEGKYLSAANLDWFKIYQNYIETFGKENVLAVPFELFKEDLNVFLNLFYDFTGIEAYYPEKLPLINTRTKEVKGHYKPLLDAYEQLLLTFPGYKLRKKFMKNDKGLREILVKFHYLKDYTNQKMTEDQKNQLMAALSESNKKLSEALGTNLGQYGYY